MMRAWVLLWAFPATALGLLVALLARISGGRVEPVDGVIEVAGGLPARLLIKGFPFSGPVMAMTLGHVVIGISEQALTHTRLHERAHVRQFERWGGLMLLLYPIAGLWVALRGFDPYRDNPFERNARAAECIGNSRRV
jgi:hypothetical protein